MAGKSISNLAVILSANASPFGEEMQRAQARLRAFEADVARQNAAAESTSFSGLMKGAAALYGTLKIAEGLKWGVSIASQAQKAELAFTQMLGSAEKAKNVVKEIREFAAGRGIDPSTMMRGVQQLLIAQVSAADAMRITKAAMSAAALSPQGMEEGTAQIVRALSQMKAKGKASAEEIGQQLAEAGVGGWQMIADKLGMKIAQVQKLAESGMLDSATAIIAIVEGMEKKFGGSIEKGAGTMEGAWNKLKATAGQALANIFDEKFQSGAVRVMGWLEGLIGTLQKVFGFVEKIVDNVLGPPIRWLVDGVSWVSDKISNSMIGKGLKYLFGVEDEQIQKVQKLGETTKKSMDMAKEALSPAAKGFEEFMKSLKTELDTFGMDDHTKKLMELRKLGLGAPQMERGQAMVAQLTALERRKKLLEEGADLEKSLRTPQEQYNARMLDLNRLLDGGAISWETYSRGINKAAEDLRNSNPLIKEAEDLVKGLDKELDRLKLGETGARIKELREKGHSESTIQEFEGRTKMIDVLKSQVELQREANDLIRAQVPEIDRARERWEQARESFRKGILNQEQFDAHAKALEDAEEKYASSRRRDEGPKFAEAATAGSQAAYAAVIRAATGTKHDDPAAADRKQQIQEAKKQTELQKKIADKQGDAVLRVKGLDKIGAK